MSIRNYFRPRNGLPEPVGSISVALKSRAHGTSSPPCARSAEYFLCPVTVTPHCKNCEHTRYTFRGRCPMIVPSFFVATAYRSKAFSDSLSHTNDSPTADIRGSLEYSNSFRKTLPWQLLSPYISSPCSSLPLRTCTCLRNRLRYCKRYVVKFLC